MNSRIAFLGCGSMGRAILAGLLGQGQTDPSSIVATVRRTEQAVELAERYGIIAIATSEEPKANQLAVVGADVVLLGVKPAQIVPLCREVSGTLSARTILVSVAAAVSLEQLQRALPAGQPVVRSMPNTPLMVGRGVVALSAATCVDESQMARVRSVFSGSGLVLEVPEEQMSAISAISGSGPAYVFYLAEAMAAAGRELGLAEESSRALAKETVAGAGLMLTLEGADPGDLRRAVTSPNGTTEQAIAAFDERGLRAVVLAGACAAAARSEEITRELN